MRALRPVAPHDGPVHRGPGRDAAAVRPRRQQLRERSRSDKAKQFVAVQPRRLRDRRRDPLLPRRGRCQPRRPAVGPQLGAVPRRDRRLRRRARAGRARRRQPDRPRKLYRFQVQGPTALEVLEKANGGPLPEIKFFNLGEFTIAGHAGARAAPRHVRRARPRAVRPVGGGRGRPGRARRGRRGVRPAAGRLARLRHQHARVGLDPVPAAGDLHRRRR